MGGRFGKYGDTKRKAKLTMQEIRIHGRGGGQGTVVASILLVKAFFSTGYYESYPTCRPGSSAPRPPLSAPEPPPHRLIAGIRH